MREWARFVFSFFFLRRSRAGLSGVNNLVCTMRRGRIRSLCQWELTTLYSQNPRASYFSSGTIAGLAGFLSCLLVLSLTPAAPAQEIPPPTDTVKLEASTAASADPAGPDSPSVDGRLKFNFRHAPWEDVLEWLATEAGLSFSADVIPTGTFNYLDEERTFNTEEAIDLVNSYLLIKGYTLVRKGKMLLVIDLEEEIDAQLVRDLLTETPLSELDKRGDYEITKTRFLLDKMDAAEAEKQINQLLSPVGSIVVMPKAKQLMVTETGGTLRMMRGILETLESTAAAEESGKLHMFPLKIASADEVLMVARPLLGIPEDGSAAEDNSIRISADPLGRTVFATGTAEKIKLVEQIVESVDSRAGTSGANNPAEAPQFMSYPVSATSPDAVLRVLQTLFVGDPAIRLEVDQSTRGIIAYATAAQHRTIKATIAEMERNPERVEVLSLNGTDPTVAAALVEKLFSGVEKPPVVDGTFDPPQLVVRGTQPQIEQIRDLLTNVGENSPTLTSSVVERGNLRLLPMDSETARAVAERIQGIWPNLRQNPIRVVVPSRSSSSLQTERPDATLMEAPGRPGGRMFRGSRPPGGDEMNRARRPEGDRRPARPDESSPEGERPAVDRPVRTTLDAPASSQLVPVSYQGPADADSPSETAASAEPSADNPPTAAAEPPAGNAAAEEASADQPSSPAAPASPAGGEAEDKTPPEIIISPTPQGLMITSDDPDALDTIQSLVEMFASQETSSQPQFHLFYLKHVEAETAKTLITSILTGVTGTDISSLTVGSATDSGGSSGRGGGSLSQGRPATSTTATTFSTLPHIVADKRLNALFVNGTLQQITLVKQLLEVVDSESGPEEILTFPRPKFIPVYHTKAETVANVLRQVYANRIETATQNNRGQQQDPRQGRRLSARLRGTIWPRWRRSGRK